MSSDAEGGHPSFRVEVPHGQGVQIGQGNQQVNQFIGVWIQELHVTQAPVTGPVVAGEVPQRPPAFQLRRELLATVLADEPGVGPARVVTGMRGAGKTQLAATYARSCIDAGWRLVAWVNAESTGQVLNGLALVASRLGITVPDGGLDALGSAVRNRLEADGDRCLLVFDNVIDIAGLRKYLPSAGRSRVIITGTQWDLASLGTSVAVAGFREDEALAFLSERTGRGDTTGARALAEELGYLPLALAQAAAVIAAPPPLDYGTYLDRLRAASVQSYLTQPASEPYPHAVAEAVLLSLDAAASADRTGLGETVVDVLSLLSAAGVPRALLYAGGQAGVFSRPGEADSVATQQQVDEALGHLAGASLVSFSVDYSTAIAHRLVLRIARERRLNVGDLAALGARVARLLLAVTGSLDEPWLNGAAARDAIQQIGALHQNLSPHLGEQDAAVTEQLLELRGWALWCRNALGDNAEQAVQQGESLVDDFARILGDAHPETLTSRGNLGVAYAEAGRSSEAIALLERNLAQCERVFGDTHPSTLSCRNNLAAAYEASGRLTEAIPLLERTLDDRERVPGSTQRDTLIARSHLASAYLAAGRTEEALALHERVLRDFERVFGDDDPDTLTARNNLARLYASLERNDDAVPLLEQNLDACTSVLGAAHPHTIAARGNLAYAYQVAGRSTRPSRCASASWRTASLFWALIIPGL